MSSPHPKGAEISSGNIVSETDSAAKSHKSDMKRRRETRQSPFKVPDSKSIFLLSVNERGERKEEMCKFLSLPIDEKTTHAAQMIAKLGKELEEQVEEEEEEVEEKEKMKNQKQIKTKTVLPKQTPSRHELKMAMMKRENITKESKHDLISMERQKAVLELSLMTKRSEILRMDKAIAKEEAQLRQLEKIIERDNLKFEEFLRENEKKSVEARTFFEQEAKIKQEKNAEIKKLTAEIGTIQSEIAKFEEILIDYKRYKELLFQLSPPEWQEAQKTKALKAKVLPGGDAGDKQNGELEESAVKNGLESKDSSPGRELPSMKETRPPSAHSNTQITTSKLDSDSSEYEDEPELYFTDPQQLLDLVTELTDHNLSLIQNSTRVEETLEELRESMETTRKKIEKDEEQLTLQIADMNQRIDIEKARGAKLRQKVQLHVSLNTEDQDVMLDALGEKVVEVHRCCVDDRITNLSTLEKLANIENRMSLLLQGLESIPEENLEIMKKIKDSERRSRQREEKLREQREKQKDRMRRYLERSLADSKKITGRKLMPRCKPVAQKVKIRNVDDTSAEDEMHAYLFSSEDLE
ncbi:cilia- and flagella-associated protein 100-like [Epinephelus fuscoguttatus]|uniref:cilia- and flagella-associated protein 100-like n=1 Tax=Epinephelus fuscoguttatus TaxID=293821 RepID=UPI0020D1905A|nr:cilia- and flagella-associated protein 100-like [Epinephelus fuscoguttatus]XP_049442596.1 cilia- and flagella-associated protein 100-like [Epinephelus fuscoguttatus]